MFQVVLRGWRVGLRKVALNALLREQAGLGARAAHRLVEQLMDGESVHVAFSDEEGAQAFIKNALELGVVAGRVERRK